MSYAIVTDTNTNRPDGVVVESILGQDIIEVEGESFLHFTTDSLDEARTVANQRAWGRLP